MFYGDNGADTITDFEDGFDQIDFTPYAASSVNDFDINQQDAGTVISGYNGNGNTITLENFDRANLSNDDFIFTPKLSIKATDASKAEGDTGITQFTFTVTREGETSGLSTVDWEVKTTSGDTVDGGDFVLNTTSGSLTYEDGDASEEII